MIETKNQIGWPAVRRWNEVDAEIRIALYRVIAIFLLYSLHRIFQPTGDFERDLAYDKTVTLVAILCGLSSITAILCIRMRWFPTRIAHCFFGLDIASVGWLIMARHHADPVVMLLIPVLFTAVLRLRIEQVWVGTVMALLLVRARWQCELSGLIKVDEPGISEPFLTMAVLLLSGILAGQIIRRTMALTRMIRCNVEGA